MYDAVLRLEAPTIPHSILEFLLELDLPYRPTMAAPRRNVCDSMIEVIPLTIRSSSASADEKTSFAIRLLIYILVGKYCDR